MENLTFFSNLNSNFLSALCFYRKRWNEVERAMLDKLESASCGKRLSFQVNSAMETYSQLINIFTGLVDLFAHFSVKLLSILAQICQDKPTRRHFLLLTWNSNFVKYYEVNI